jgi:nucleoside-diphosphate-sugar epimerase
MRDDWRGRRVLIAGGLGFLGTNLARDLIERGALVTAVDVVDPESAVAASRLRGAGSGLAIRRFDLLDTAPVREAVAGQDVIYCLAGQVSHIASMSDPLGDLRGNCQIHLNILEACRETNPGTTLLYASTRQVYGRQTELPVTERSSVAPVDINGVHKRAVEEYFRLYAQQHGLRTASLRLTNTYGPRMDVVQGDRGFAGVLIGKALRGEPISIFGTGEQVRDFNYVGDVVRALELAADLPVRELDGQVWNFGDPWPCSVRDFVDALSELLPVPVRHVPFPEGYRSIEIGHYCGDYQKFHNATEWSPEVPLREGLRRTIRYFRAHAEEYQVPFSTLSPVPPHTSVRTLA